MKHNIGSADRLIRIAVAVGLFALFFAGVITGVWGTVTIVLAAVFLLTGFAGYCPLYFLLGISTLHDHAEGQA